MKTIAGVLVFLASVAAWDYRVCLDLHFLDGAYAGNVMISAADGAPLVNVDPRVNWSSGFYSFRVTRTSLNIDCTPMGEHSYSQPLQFTLKMEMGTPRVETNHLMVPDSFIWDSPFSIVGRSVIVDVKRDFPDLYACGMIREMRDKDENCGRENSMTTVLITPTTKRTTTKRTTTKRTTTKRTSTTTTKVPDTDRSYQRRSWFWNWCHHKFRFGLY